jgi:hypothetical protein
MLTTFTARVAALFLLCAAPSLAQQHQLEKCLSDAIRESESASKIKVVPTWDRATALGDFSPRSAGTADGVFCAHAVSATGARFTVCLDHENPYTDNARKVVWSLLLTARGDASLVDKSCGAGTMPTQAWRIPVKTSH